MALSMWEVPTLASWWQALRSADVIKTSTTVVRPGPSARAWLTDETPDVNDAEMIIGLFLAGWLSDEALGGAFWGERTFALAVAQLIQAISDETIADGEATIEQWMSARVQRRFRELNRLGIIDLDADGVATVQPELRGAVARGLILALDTIRSAWE
jgi:hypothetical protein